MFAYGPASSAPVLYVQSTTADAAGTMFANGPSQSGAFASVIRTPVNVAAVVFVMVRW